MKIFDSDLEQYTIQDVISGIKAAAFGGTGDSGTIFVQAPDISLSDSGTISTSTAGIGKAGDITLETASLALGNEASVSSSSTLPENGGSAGTISVNADSVRLKDNSTLTTEAASAGGGKISLNAGDTLYLLDSDITSSVAQGEGKGGDVTVGSGDEGVSSVILNHSHITANAEAGDGGAIFIRTETFLKSSDSVLDASSNRGEHGTVKVEAPDVDISGSLTPVSDNPLDARQWLPKTCKERVGDRSTFIIKGRDAEPTTPEDLQASPPRPVGSLDEEKEQTGVRK